jgi:DNA end-binding protein Ku
VARSLWTGTISFGLVSVPVRMFSATESKELRFHFLDKRDLDPMGYEKVRRDTGDHVDNDEIVRGFEVEKGRYLPLEDEDLDRLDIELTKTINTCDFVDLMAALRESVEKTQKNGSKSRKRARKAS